MSQEKGIIPPYTSKVTDTMNRENTLSHPLKNVSSSSSVKVRKSSNIFSTLVRKARRKKTGSKNGSDTAKKSQASSHNLSGSSTMSLATHAEEVELNCQNYENKCSQNEELLWEGRGIRSETNTSNHSELSSVKTGRNILDLKNTTPRLRIFNDDIAKTNFKNNIRYDIKEAKEETPDFFNVISQESVVLSSFVNFGQPTLDVTYADALQYLQQIINSFHESENHIINLLVKYVTDPIVQKEMRNVISNHTKLQWEAERRSCSLANDIWMQQLEVGRAQEKILQGTLHSLMMQNRQLQIENESLYRKYEKANKLLKGYDHKSKYQECDSHLDAVLRRNEKLQIKLESIFKKIESLECELHIYKKQNDGMEEQLRNSTAKIQNMKVLVHKMKTEYQIDQAALNFKIESKDQTLKEAVEIGEMIADDLDMVKRQFKDVPCDVNWSKFKVRGNYLCDLMHTFRLCINELSKEVINIHTAVTLKEKDLIALRDTNKTLQENLQKSLHELDIVSNKVQEASSLSNENNLLEQKCRTLKDELKTSDEEIQRLREQHEAENSSLLQNMMGHDKYIKELQDKDNMIQQTKFFLSNITSENYALQKEIVTLNRIIDESGAGDMVREIEQEHEQLENSRKELKKLQSENLALKHKTETEQNEHATLIANLELAHKTLEMQVKENERLNEGQENFKKKFETEHETVLSLQTERMKYLEEKNILTTIIQHLKSELSKIKQLENTLSTVTKEASKLGLIADYNKKQGDKLRYEVMERDSKIAQLSNSMQKLQDVQFETTKEKLSLSYELKEVSQLKEKIADILNTEVKKNAELDQSKEAIVKSATSQIQKIEEKHRNERTAIKILLRDMKTVAEEKENVLKEKHTFQIEIEQLKLNLVGYKTKFDNAIKELTVKNEEIKELRKEVGGYLKRHKDSNEKLDNETLKYDLNVKHLKKLIEQLRDEKKELENSSGYLKNNMEKLTKDLNDSRQSEKSAIDVLNRLQQDQEEAKRLLIKQTKAANELLNDKEKITEEKYQLLMEKNNLTKEIQCLNTLMDKVVNDFEKSIKTAEEKEKMFKEELDESKQILFNYGREIQDLKQAIELKDRRIEDMKDLGKMDHAHEKRYNKLKEEMTDLETECTNLKEAKADLENQLSELKDDHNNLTNHVADLEKEISVLESQQKIILDQKEDDYIFYKNHIAEITRNREELMEQSQKEANNLRSKLQDIAGRLDHERTAYETLAQVHKDVSAKYMKSIKELVDVKNARQEAMEKSIQDNKTTQTMENEQVEMENFKNCLEEKETQIHGLKLKITELQKQITLLKIERTEITLQLHEIEKKLETEKNLAEQLKNTKKLLLAAVMQLKEDGKVDSSDCIHLLHMVRSSSYLSIDDARARKSE